MLLQRQPKTLRRETNWPRTTCSHGPWSHGEIHKDACYPEQHRQYLQEVSSCSSVWVSACEITRSREDGWWAVDLRTNKQETKSEWSRKGGLLYLMQFLQSLVGYCNCSSGGTFKRKTKTGIKRTEYICIEYFSFTYAIQGEKHLTPFGSPAQASLVEKSVKNFRGFLWLSVSTLWQIMNLHLIHTK